MRDRPSGDSRLQVNPINADRGPLPTSQPKSGLPKVGLIVGVWAALPYFLGPQLSVAKRVEVVDHVVPGLVVVGTSALVLAGRHRAHLSPTAAFAAGPVLFLAAFWMAITHVPLIAQAARHDAPWIPTLWHSASALAVLVLGVVWAKDSWAAAGPGP